MFQSYCFLDELEVDFLRSDSPSELVVASRYDQ